MKKYQCKKCKDWFECRDMEQFSLCPECDTDEGED